MKGRLRAKLITSMTQTVPFIAAANLLSPVLGATRTENFDSAPAGWVGLQNGGGEDEYGPYGFSNTNNTAGASGAGEAGGIFQRTASRNYYADTALGPDLTETNAFGASGEIFVNAVGADNDVLVGHFAKPPGPFTVDELNHSGIILRESGATTWRFMARLRGDGSSQHDGDPVVVPNGAYKFEYNYDPGTQKLKAQLFPIGGGAAIATSETPSLFVLETFKADSFGLSGGFNSTGTAQMTAFIDAVTYTIGTTPILGDANGDGHVNSLDFAALAAHFNESGTGIPEGNFNGDNVTNALDFNALATNYGYGDTGPLPSAAAVPEPATLALLVAGLSLLRRRR